MLTKSFLLEEHSQEVLLEINLNRINWFCLFWGGKTRSYKHILIADNHFAFCIHVCAMICLLPDVMWAKIIPKSGGKWLLQLCKWVIPMTNWAVLKELPWEQGERTDGVTDWFVSLWPSTMKMEKFLALYLLPPSIPCWLFAPDPSLRLTLHRLLWSST